VVQQGLEHGGVALQRHALVGVLKVAAVLRQKDRHPGGGVGVDLLRRLPPLLHGVADKDVAIHIVGQGGQLRVGILPQLQNGDLFLHAIGGYQLLRQGAGLLRRKGGPQGDQVEGHRVLQPPVPVGEIGHHLVLVGPPAGEAGEIVKHAGAVGVEDMGAVLVDQHPRLVEAIIGVAAHMVPALQHQYPLAAPLGQLPGRHGTGQAGSDDKAVILMIHGESSSLLWCQTQCTTGFGKKG